MSVVPDMIEPLVGYRAWNLLPGGYLCSINQDTSDPWSPKTKKIAVCTQYRSATWQAEQLVLGGDGVRGAHYLTSSMMPLPPQLSAALVDRFKALFAEAKAEEQEHHHSPVQNCSCGVYAAKSNRTQHYASYAEGAGVWGEVYLWGKVQEYTEGYRAEFAYPKSLSTAAGEDVAELLGQRYDVPCEFINERRSRPSVSSGLTVNIVSSSGTSSSVGNGWMAPSTSAAPFIASTSAGIATGWRRFFS